LKLEVRGFSDDEDGSEKAKPRKCEVEKLREANA
jgi:hypothetical protein